MHPRWAWFVLLLPYGAFAEELPGFSFDYQITGDRSIAPFQVFDDGISTFLQFRDPTKVPSIFVRDANGSRLVVPQPQGTYHRIEGVSARLEVVSERKTATITSTRKRSEMSAASRPGVSGSIPSIVPTLPPMPPPPMKEVRPLPPVAPKSGEETIAQVEQLRRVVAALEARLNTLTPTPQTSTARAADVPATALAPPKEVPKETKAPAKEAPKDVFIFEVEAGQRLSEAVRRFAAGRGYELDWDTGGADFEIRHAFRIGGGSLEEVLYGALGPFKLSAVAHHGNRVLAVTRAS